MRPFFQNLCVPLLVTSVFANNFKKRDLNDLLSAAGIRAEGVPTKLVFINHFNYMPISHFPTKRNGPYQETPPNRRFLLPEFSVYSVQFVYILLSMFIFFHLLRRRQIDHTGDDYYEIDQEDESKLAEMRSARRSDRSRLYFYQRWTSHVATSWKLFSTFQKDFATENHKEDKKVKTETIRLRKPSFEEDDDF